VLTALDEFLANGIHLMSVETTAFHSGSDEKGGSKAAADEANAQWLIERAPAILARVHPDLHVEVRPYLITDRLARRELDRLADLLAQAMGRRAPAVPEVGQPPTRMGVTWTEDLPDVSSEP